MNRPAHPRHQNLPPGVQGDGTSDRQSGVRRDVNSGTNISRPTARVGGSADAAQVLADGLAHHARRWASAQGADAATAALAGQAVHALSLATSEGHVCITLAQLSASPSSPSASAATVKTAAAGLRPTPSAWRRLLLASGLAGTPAAPGAKPLVLDDEDRLYLHRDFALERRLAERLVACLNHPPQALPAGIANAANGANGATDGATNNTAPPAAAAGTSTDGDTGTGTGPDWQALAAALALRGRLTIISGGPGTGKTTAVVRLLGLLLAEAPACRIALAAPTGKAAARMTEAIRQRAGELPTAVRDLLPATASTLHRLLGVSPAARGGPGQGFVHHAGHPLPIDVLVIDEASMLDLALATRVLEAVPAGARIILLGDQDQLAAVESGAVFAELSADPSLDAACIADLARACGLAPEAIHPPPPRAVTGLHNSVVWFSHNFRFARDSAIGRLAQEINGGDPARALDWLAAQSAQSAQSAGSGMAAPHTPGLTAPAAVRWVRDTGAAPSASTEALLAEGYADYLATVQAHARGHATPSAVLQAFDRFRVLCALRVGPRGVAALNQRLTRQLRRRLGTAHDTDPRSPWYPGRPVMVLRNDPVLRLFNGDIGITLPRGIGDNDEGNGNGGDSATDSALEVFFADPDGLRSIAPVRLPEHDSAWAMTVHQSQGSEFDAVAVLLPAEPHRVLSRELLYTAVTRARHKVTLIGGAAVIAAGMAAPTRRHSGLVARLREARGRSTNSA